MNARPWLEAFDAMHASLRHFHKEISMTLSQNLQSVIELMALYLEIIVLLHRNDPRKHDAYYAYSQCQFA
jgi:hypothetical protein